MLQTMSRKTFHSLNIMKIEKPINDIIMTDVYKSFDVQFNHMDIIATSDHMLDTSDGAEFEYEKVNVRLMDTEDSISNSSHNQGREMYNLLGRYMLIMNKTAMDITMDTPGYCGDVTEYYDNDKVVAVDLNLVVPTTMSLEDFIKKIGSLTGQESMQLVLVKDEQLYDLEEFDGIKMEFK